MPRNSRTIISPVNGLEIGAPPSLIDQRSSPNCKNVGVRRLLIETREGNAQIGLSLGERILRYGAFQQTGINYLVRIGKTKVEALVGNSTTWASIANAPLTGIDTTMVDVAYPILAGKKILVYTNGIDNIRKWTGTGNDADLGGTPPKAKYLLNYGGFLLAANVNDGSPSILEHRVQWPDAGDPEQWDGTVPGSLAGSVDLLEDDVPITGMGYFGQYAAIHKQNSIYNGYLTGQDDVFRFDRRNTGAGAIAHRTIINLPNGQQIFLASDGFRLYNGMTAPPIPGTINYEIVDSMAPAYAYRSWGLLVRELNEVWFGVPIGSSQFPDTIYKYNYATGQIFRDNFASVFTAGLFLKVEDDDWDDDPNSWDSDTTSFDDVKSLDLNPAVIWGYDSGLSSERTDGADDNGTAVESIWDSKDFTAADFELDDPEGILLEWQGVEIEARGSQVTLSYSTDEGLSWTLIKTFTLASNFPTDSAPLVAYFRKPATKCRFRFSKNAVGATWQLKQFRPMAVPREGRRV